MPSTKPPFDFDSPLELTDEPPLPPALTRSQRLRREWGWVVLALVATLSVLAVIGAAFAVSRGDHPDTATAPAPKAAAPAPAAADAPAPTLAEAKGVDFEPFERVDPTLPAIPAGEIKTFKVDVYQHVTQVSKDLAPTEVWSYKINGVEHRGTGVSEPMVVTEGDTVDFTLTNGSTQAMKVDLPHSLDFHSAEVNPGARYADLAPGKSMRYRFVAKHPGVFMYHCATQPVLLHTGAGMVGAFIVKPKNLAPVDRELWITQQEFYIGKPGQDADMAKMAAKKPDVIAFNGYANQYKDAPIAARKDEKIRIYVLNAGPSIWSAFHVIGTVFDRTVIEGTVGRSAQTVNLAPSQGGWVEFTLDEEGTYPFVTHAFGDAVKGAIGVLQTAKAPTGGGHDMESGAANAPAAAAKGDVNVTLGDMWLKSDKTSFKAGKISFSAKNEGATMHGLSIVKAPAQVSGGMLEHDSMLVTGGNLKGGESETISADLKPGKYELVCHVPGHYAAGQKLAFTVTS